MKVLKISKSQIGVQVVKCSLMLVLFSMFWASCTPKITNGQLETAQQLLWQNPDSCLRILTSVDTIYLREKEQKEWQLFYEHARMRATYMMPSDSVIQDLADYFTLHSDYRHAGEAYYLLGTIASYNDRDGHSATLFLKEAEYNLTHADNVIIDLLGVLYYRLGEASADERLYEVALSYYDKALPHLKKAKNNLYIACAYRDMAFAMQDSCQQNILTCIDSAMHYAQIYGSELFCLEIESAKIECVAPGSPEVRYLYHLLCDSLGSLTYGAELANYYLLINQPDSAKYYIDLLCQDTSSIWAKEHYQYLQAEYLSAIGEKDSAIQVLQDLHNRQTAEIENTAFARTYAIAQRYDLVKEQEHTLELQVRQQRLYLLIAIVLLVGLVIAIVAIYQTSMRRIRHQQELAHQQKLLSEKQLALVETEKQAAVMRVQLSEKRQTLHMRLHDRLILAQQLNHDQQMQVNAKVPKWAEKYIAYVAISENQYAEIIREFDVAYDNAIGNLRRTYPQLTDSDAIVICLMLMGFTIVDSCVLLNLEKNTLWVRRKRIRRHLDLPQDTDLDEWLQQAIASTDTRS